MSKLSFSNSMLSAAYRCGQYFKLLYVDKLKPTKTQKSADLVFGSSVHFAIEEHYEGSNILDAFHMYWDTEAPNLEYGRYKREELERIAEILLERFVRLHAKNIVIKEQEQRLYTKIDDISLEGTPDVLGEYKGVPSIIDFKTSGYRYPKEKITIDPQMQLYHYLAKANGFTAEQLVYIVFIKAKEPSIQVLTSPVNNELIDKTMMNVVKQCKDIEMKLENNIWTYNTQSCMIGGRKCDYFEKCWENK